MNYDDEKSKSGKMNYDDDDDNSENDDAENEDGQGGDDSDDGKSDEEAKCYKTIVITNFWDSLKHH